MVALKCKMCGGTLEIESGATVGTCEYCGTKQTLPKTIDEKVTNLFNRANNLRIKCEFDKALSIYEKIVEQDDGEAEAHWGIVLCRYGIEYVEDPATKTRIPTCHRTLYEPVSKDVDYQAAVDFADAFQQAIYEKEARAIDRIQKDILAIVQNKSPFDVFICYKETDEEGKRTKDSVFANDIYYQLTQEGFKVFFAAITLEDKLGQEYEPYIFAALNTAKVMLVIGSKPEYFNAVWVKNEWSRFMNFMKTDRSKILIPCYRDMDAYDLPEEFAHLQAQDMGKIGFINDVIRGIKKIIPKNDSPKSVSAEKVIKAENSTATPTAYNTSSLLERAFLFLEDGKWIDADSYFEKVLDIEPKNARAYLGKLLTGLNIKKKEDLITCKKSFRNNDNYGKMMRFGNDQLKKEIESILKKVEFEERYCQMIENVNGSPIADSYGSDFNYEDKLDEMESLTVKYDNLAEEFKKIGEYKESGLYLNKCIDESKLLKEKIESIKISSEQERIRLEKEEQRRKEEERLKKLKEEIKEEKIPIFDNVFAYKVGYNIYKKMQIVSKTNISLYNQTVKNLEKLKDKTCMLEAKNERLNNLNFDKKSLGVLDFSRKKYFDNEIEILGHEIYTINDDIENIKKLIPQNLNLSIDDSASISNSIGLLNQQMNKCNLKCPELEKLNVYFNELGMGEIINSATDLDIDKIAGYILATEYFEKEEYEKTFIVLNDIKDFCDASFKLQLLKDKYHDKISDLLLSNPK